MLTTKIGENMNSNARRKVRRKMARLEEAGKLRAEVKQQIEQLIAEDRTVDITDEGEIDVPTRRASTIPRTTGGTVREKVVDKEKLKAQVLRLKEIIEIRTKQRESGRKNAQDERHAKRTESYAKLLAKKEAKLAQLGA
jgi:predicted RNA-binding Zn ribbon-like protein